MKFYFFLISLLLLVACGTDTGNPGQEPSNLSAGDILELPYDQVIPTLVESICNKVETCHPGASQCESDLLLYDNIDEEIGLTKDSTESLQSVHEKLSQNELEADRYQVSLCLPKIEELSCESPEVQGAYSKTFDKPFSGVAAMLPKECNGIIIEE